MLLGFQEPAVLLLALALAVCLDGLLGEPPNAVHPVAWMGALAGTLASPARGGGPVRQTAVGVLVALLVPAAAVATGVATVLAARGWPVAEAVVTAGWCKVSFALRALGAAARRVGGAVERGDLAAARAALPALCSRDPATLDAGGLSGAAVSSVAENTSDSVVAPLCWYVAFGVPGALAYRAVNTLDAMFGYRDHRRWLGLAPARLDDAANWLPARITAALLCLAAVADRRRPTDGWRGWRRDGGRTPSPNGGRPMAAMAGVLGVRLEKPGVYVLGAGGAVPTAAHVAAAWRIARAAGAVAIVLAAGGLALHAALVR